MDITSLPLYFLTLSDNEFHRIFIALAIVLPLSTICHEAGHYYAAKLCGIDCKEFSLFNGPALLKLRVSNECNFVLRLFPIGGYVVYNERYNRLSYGQRAFICAAGWLADVIVATIVLTVAYIVGTREPVTVMVCCLVIYKVAIYLLPVTRDNRSVLRNLSGCIKKISRE